MLLISTHTCRHGRFANRYRYANTFLITSARTCVNQFLQYVYHSFVSLDANSKTSRMCQTTLSHMHLTTHVPMKRHVCVKRHSRTCTSLPMCPLNATYVSNDTLTHAPHYPCAHKTSRMCQTTLSHMHLTNHVPLKRHVCVKRPSRTCTSLPMCPYFRGDCKAATVNGMVYVLGGAEYNPDGHQDTLTEQGIDVDCNNPEGDDWKKCYVYSNATEVGLTGSPAHA